MSLHRFFVDGSLASGPAVVTGPAVHHLRDVLRLRPGDEIAVADRDGAQAVARLTSVGDEAVAEVVRMLSSTREPDVTLLQGLSRGPKMDLVVQKATEIGVSRIIPVSMHRSVVKLDEGDRAKRAERWRRIALEAAQQSQRATVSRIDDAIALSDAASLLASFDIVLVPWEETERGSAPGIGQALAEAGATAESRVAVVVGPEGGIEADEVAWLRELGVVPVSLGSTILRTETAAIVAVALATFVLGGLGGARP